MNGLHIGFTGTRGGMNEFQTEQFTQIISAFAPLKFCFHHGDCIGADFDAHNIVIRVFNILKLEPNIEIHPGHDINGNVLTRANCVGWKNEHPIKQYLKRDKDIVTQSDILIAIPQTSDMTIRSGTWTTVRYALKQHKGVIIIPPYL